MPENLDKSKVLKALDDQIVVYKATGHVNGGVEALAKFLDALLKGEFDA